MEPQMREHLVSLRQILTDRFDEEGLRTLCFDLGIDYDDLPGRGKAAKARELVSHLQRCEQIPDCIAVGHELRPDIPWAEIELTWLEAAQEKASDPRRFQPSIEERRTTVARWDQRVERQRARIAAGLKEERQRRAREQFRRYEREEVRVVGQPPLDMADYFKDRQRELKELTDALAEPITRLISVIGHGGMGKTALACKVLRDIERHRWPHVDEDLPVDGIAYLSTRTAGISLERIFLDCAKLLGSEREDRLNAVWTSPHLQTGQKIARLLSTLSDGRYVILLDNLDDLLDGQGQFFDDDLRLFFDQALTNVGNPKLIVTSRVGLALRRELMRFDRHVKLLQGLPVEDGVALLRDLDPNSDYGLRDASEERLAKAVETVHGTPRALEVLAGILANDPFVSLEEVLEKFYGHEDVVHALIEENYRRLDRDARRVVEALAIFRKPVPVLAIDYLLKPFAPGLDVPGIVRWLSRSNIVSVDRVTKMVTLHPIDQDYAYSQLPEEGEAELAYTRQALERRAADYYAQLRAPEDAWKSIDDLDPQLNEFEFRIRVGDYDEACCILKSIDADHLYLWGHYTRLFTMREQLLGRLKSKCLEMDNLGSFGRVCYGLGLYEKSRSLHFRALAISRELKDLREEALQLGRLGVTYRELGWDEEAIAYHKRSLGIARKIDDPEIESLQFGRLSIAYRMMQEVEQALEYNQLAIAKAQDPRRIGNWIGSLGLVYRKLGQFRKAVKCHSKAMSIVVTEGDRRSEGSNIGNLGLVYRQLGMVEESVDQYEKALLIATEIGDRRREAIWLHRIGAIAYDLGQMTRAVEYFEESLSISVDIKHPAGESFCLLGLGKALLVSGDLSRAQSSCRKALDLDVASTGYQAALALGLVLLHQQTSPATKEFSKTIQLCRGLLERTAGLYQARYTLSAALVGQAVCDPLWTEEGERLTLLAPALEEYRRALDITAAPGVVQDAIGVLELIQAAEIEGLKPVFDLLENAEYKPDEVPPDFLADLS